MIGSAVFLVIAPGFVAGLVPWWISRWRLETPFFGMPLFRLAGEYERFCAEVPRWIPAASAMESEIIEMVQGAERVKSCMSPSRRRKAT